MRFVFTGAVSASVALLSSHHDEETSVVDARLHQTKGLYELVRANSHNEDAAEFGHKYAEIRKGVGVRGDCSWER